MNLNNIKISPSWSKSKESIWDERFAELQDEKTPKTRNLGRKPIVTYAIAAAIIAIVALPTTAYLYTKEVKSPKGKHVTTVLPDGSTVQLNADSKLQYKPLWWYVSRSASLQGEAYFEVTKGSTFSIHTSQATVSVLGTSFNIYARASSFNATCLTGKVKVEYKNKSAILTPNMQASANGAEVKVRTLEYPSKSIGWVNHLLCFTASPLSEVIAEVERQYNIKVKTSQKTDYLYTGTFSKEIPPEDALEIIGKPFGVKFTIE